jgi:Flp pilus assembly protein protease CpaA
MNWLFTGKDGPYFFAYAYAVLILLYAAWWDSNEYRVPNWVWLASLPLALVCSSVQPTWSVLLIIPIFAALVGFRLLGSWGMGDVKAVGFALLTVGVIPAILALGAGLLAGVFGKGSRIAFLPRYVSSLLAVGFTLWVGLIVKS